MNITQAVYLFSSLASVIAAILAWIAKIRWSDEYSKAKDETIKAKDALLAIKEAQIQTVIMNKDEIIKAKEEQIKGLEREVQSLNELTPMKIREYFLSVRQQIEEYNDFLKNQLNDASKEIEKKSEEIEKLKSEGTQKTEAIMKLEEDRQEIAQAAASLETQIDTLRKKYESDDVVLMRMPRIDVSAITEMDAIYKQLSEFLTKDISVNYDNVFKSILATNLALTNDQVLKAFSSWSTPSRKELFKLKGSTIEDDSSDKDSDSKKDENDDDDDENSVSVVAG